MKPKYSNLPPCPFCGNNVDATPARPTMSPIVVCRSCGMVGPTIEISVWINNVIMYYDLHPRHADYERARRVRQSGCIVKREETL